MDNVLAERISRKLDDLSVDVATIKVRSEESEKLQHEPRIRTLETILSTLASSVSSLVDELKDRKDSNQYLITTCISAVAILISINSMMKH